MKKTNITNPSTTNTTTATNQPTVNFNNGSYQPKFLLSNQQNYPAFNLPISSSSSSNSSQASVIHHHQQQQQLLEPVEAPCVYSMESTHLYHNNKKSNPSSPQESVCSRMSDHL